MLPYEMYPIPFKVFYFLILLLFKFINASVYHLQQGAGNQEPGTNFKLLSLKHPVNTGEQETCTDIFSLSFLKTDYLFKQIMRSLVQHDASHEEMDLHTHVVY